MLVYDVDKVIVIFCGSSVVATTATADRSCGGEAIIGIGYSGSI